MQHRHRLAVGGMEGPGACKGFNRFSQSMGSLKAWP
jgi:hypothetical protein